MIAVVGFAGAGKTTVGRLLASRLAVPFLDSDHVIEARAGRPVPEIFAADGEPAFRALEQEVIADLLGGPDAVLALGGGAAEAAPTRKLLTAVPVAYLRVSYAEALARAGQGGNRPLLARPGLAGVYERRLATYAEVATLIVDVDGRPPEDIAADILGQLR